MFNKKTQIKKIALLLLSLCVLFTSCANFLSGSDLKNAVDKKIDYEKLDSFGISVEVLPGTGTVYPNEVVYKKVSDSIELRFEPAEKNYAFTGWVVADSKSDEIVTDAIKIENASERNTIATINKLRPNLKIYPACVKRPAVVSALPNNAVGVAYSNQPVVINFSDAVDINSFRFTEEEIPEGAEKYFDSEGRIYAYSKTSGDVFDFSKEYHYKNIEIESSSGVSLNSYYQLPQLDAANKRLELNRTKNGIPADVSSIVVKISKNVHSKESADAVLYEDYEYRFVVGNVIDSAAPEFVYEVEKNPNPESDYPESKYTTVKTLSMKFADGENQNKELPVYYWIYYYDGHGASIDITFEKFKFEFDKFYAEKNVASRVLITATGTDLDSGVAGIRVTETLIRDTEGNMVHEVTDYFISDGYKLINSRTKQWNDYPYKLQSKNDGVVSLTMSVVDFAGNITPVEKEYIVIKDSTIDESLITISNIPCQNDGEGNCLIPVNDVFDSSLSLEENISKINSDRRNIRISYAEVLYTDFEGVKMKTYEDCKFEFYAGINLSNLKKYNLEKLNDESENNSVILGARIDEINPDYNTYLKFVVTNDRGDKSSVTKIIPGGNTLPYAHEIISQADSDYISFDIKQVPASEDEYFINRYYASFYSVSDAADKLFASSNVLGHTEDILYTEKNGIADGAYKPKIQQVSSEDALINYYAMPVNKYGVLNGQNYFLAGSINKNNYYQLKYSALEKCDNTNPLFKGCSARWSFAEGDNTVKVDITIPQVEGREYYYKVVEKDSERDEIAPEDFVTVYYEAKELVVKRLHNNNTKYLYVVFYCKDSATNKTYYVTSSSYKISVGAPELYIDGSPAAQNKYFYNAYDNTFCAEVKFAQPEKKDLKYVEYYYVPYEVKWACGLKRNWNRYDLKLAGNETPVFKKFTGVSIDNIDVYIPNDDFCHTLVTDSFEGKILNLNFSLTGLTDGYYGLCAKGNNGVSNDKADLLIPLYIKTFAREDCFYNDDPNLGGYASVSIKNGKGYFITGVNTWAIENEIQKLTDVFGPANYSVEYMYQLQYFDEENEIWVNDGDTKVFANQYMYPSLEVNCSNAHSWYRILPSVQLKDGLSSAGGNLIFRIPPLYMNLEYAADYVNKRNRIERVTDLTYLVTSDKPCIVEMLQSPVELEYNCQTWDVSAAIVYSSSFEAGSHFFYIDDYKINPGFFYTARVIYADGTEEMIPVSFKKSRYDDFFDGESLNDNLYY